MTKDSLTDFLIDTRELARECNNFALSDLIRDELDKRNCFIIDTKEGQEVYHLTDPMSRVEFLKNITDINLNFRKNNLVKNEK